MAFFKRLHISVLSLVLTLILRSPPTKLEFEHSGPYTSKAIKPWERCALLPFKLLWPYRLGQTM